MYMCACVLVCALSNQMKGLPLRSLTSFAVVPGRECMCTCLAWCVVRQQHMCKCHIVWPPVSRRSLTEISNVT